MPDHLAHLQHPTLLAAQQAWQEHVHGSEGRPACPQCSAAPGPPPPDCPPTQRDLYACDEGLRLHEVAVRAAHEAYLETVDGG